MGETEYLMENHCPETELAKPIMSISPGIDNHKTEMVPIQGNFTEVGTI